MHFDVPMVVRSPGCDHGHDEECRNGQDMKIDILEAYVDIRSVPGEIGIFTGVPGGYRNPPGGIWALVGFSGREERCPGLGLPLVRIGQGEGGRCPPSFSLSSFPLPNPIPTRKGGESYSRWE